MSNKEIRRYKLDDTHDLGYTSFCRVDLPKGSRVIDLSYGAGVIHLHVVANHHNKKKERWFAIFGEGTPMEDYEKKTCEYIGMTNSVPNYYIFEVHD
jgi:hypothetical protein